MINEFASIVEQSIEDNLDVSIKIPRVSKRLMNRSSKVNGIMGISLLVAGVAISSKFLIGIGALGLAGATATKILSQDLIK